MNTLRAFIRAHYGNANQCAQKLGVTPQVVGIWINKKPRNALRYMPEILMHTHVPADYFIRIIQNAELEVTGELEPNTEGVD